MGSTLTIASVYYKNLLHCCNSVYVHICTCGNFLMKNLVSTLFSLIFLTQFYKYNEKIYVVNLSSLERGTNYEKKLCSICENLPFDHLCKCCHP